MQSINELLLGYDTNYGMGIDSRRQGGEWVGVMGIGGLG